jgi:hypothetical protein
MTGFKTFFLAAGFSLVAVTAASAQQAQTPVPEQTQTKDAYGSFEMADRGEGHGPHGRHSVEGKHGGRGMHMIDANGDGVIGDDEAAGLAEHRFNRLDRDRDGNITETEFTSPPRRGWHAWFGSAESEAVMKVRKEKFAALDTNKNLGVDKAEFLAEAKAKLAAADTDKDGKVTPWEFRALR